MSYRSLRAAANELERTGQLIRIKTELDPDLEVAEVHRRIYDKEGPALLYENIKGSPFQGISNMYGTIERTEFLFRKSLDYVKKVVELKADPSSFLKNPLRYWSAPFTALTALPRRRFWNIPSLYGKTTIDQLPQIKSWKMDGGAFITLPQVFTMPPDDDSIMKSNIGMYRIQMSGNDYEINKEIGLHYQIHRGIGVHHTEYNKIDKPFRASIFVGGPPSHAFMAIMPMPEGLSELTFGGMLNNRSFRFARKDGHVISAEADFVITGIIQKGKKKKEGPFGDHLGYYSLAHDFPVMEVENVYHRKDPLWHFTVVGRPPQEDSGFGWLIHKLVEPLTGGEFPGIKEVNAVDAAGVHPLLLAIGSERYMPFRDRKPEEILTQANHLLGKSQSTLAKYVIIAAEGDVPNLTTHHIPDFILHVLERIDLTRDLHFYTKTTIDTLDYSGSDWNSGSKLVIACAGDKLRELSATLPGNFNLPEGFSNPVFHRKGILIINAPEFKSDDNYSDAQKLSKHLENFDLDSIPLIVMADDAEFTAATENNFLWVTFTRSNPSHDVHGIREFTEHKHWGCRGSLIIDARIKPHHAPVLETDKKVSERVDKLFQKGGELEKWG